MTSALFHSRRSLCLFETQTRFIWIRRDPSKPKRKDPGAIDLHSIETEKPLDQQLPYFVRRTINKNLPVYTEFKNGRSQVLTLIRRIEGDACELRKDLLKYFSPEDINVNLRNNHIVVKGYYPELIRTWLTKQGF